MDAAEAHTEKYLRHLGFTDIVHEPDGNVPPDFVLNGRIAVEVTRLLHRGSEQLRPIEETAIPLMQRFQKVLKSLGPPEARSRVGSYSYVFNGRLKTGGRSGRS